MAAICVNAEHMVEVNKRFNFLRNHTPKPMAGAEAVCSGAVMSAMDTGAKAIICITASGRAPALVSKYRPPLPVMVVTPDDQLVRHCRSVFGQVGLLVKDIDGDVQVGTQKRAWCGSGRVGSGGYIAGPALLSNARIAAASSGC